MTDAIRIWIGTEEKTNLPCKVLEHSILKHTKAPVKFFKDPGHSWKTQAGRKLGVGTGFSLQRWCIPEKMKYEGFCIYLDADMLVFGDIYEIWAYREAMQDIGKSIACTYQEDKWFKYAPATSVMLIDCAKAREQWQFRLIRQADIEEYLADDKDRKKYIALMHADEKLFYHQPLEIPQYWNNFNKPNKFTKLLHYTVEPAQPWYSPGHLFKELWRDAFVDALKEGYITKKEVEIELKRYVAPSSCCRGEGLNPYWRKFLIHATV